MPTFELDVGADGLIVEVFVGPPRLLTEASEAAGLPVPPAQPLRFLIDTGADALLVEEEWLAGVLGLESTERDIIHTPSTGKDGAEVNLYRVAVSLRHQDGSLVLGSLTVAAVAGLEGNIDGLLGREVLRHCVLHYDGPGESATISFEPSPPSD